MVNTPDMHPIFFCCTLRISEGWMNPCILAAFLCFWVLRISSHFWGFRILVAQCGTYHVIHYYIIEYVLLNPFLRARLFQIISTRNRRVGCASPTNENSPNLLNHLETCLNQMFKMLKGIHPKSLKQVSKRTPQKWGVPRHPWRLRSCSSFIPETILGKRHKHFTNPKMD